jgi:hypothetical protein
MWLQAACNHNTAPRTTTLASSNWKVILFGIHKKQSKIVLAYATITTINLLGKSLVNYFKMLVSYFDCKFSL